MTTCPTCTCTYDPVGAWEATCPWCWCLARQEQDEILELVAMLMADRERRRVEHEQRIAKAAYWLGRQMARYEVTKAQALERIDRLARACWDDICVPLHITPRGRAIGVAALTKGFEEEQGHGRRAA